MQGTITGKQGIAVVLTNGVGTFEDSEGETYTIERDGSTWIVFHEVWNELLQDWEGEEVADTWTAFAKRHHIAALVTTTGPGRLV